MTHRIELLSPAKDINIAKAAIDNGADAVYIGAPAFGARHSAANSLEDIENLVDYAHKFYCRVYVTFNTILYNEELSAAEQMIQRLYKIGVDALIIQDFGILRMKLPPIDLHASTQMHNYDIEKIKFIDKLGFKRIVLARELSIEQICKIRKEVKAELEVFIHGALCVSLSGQCYMSQYMFARSANRGECAQPCRQKWTLKDSEDKIIIKNKHILSLKDFNMSEYIHRLIEIGVDSFKIEGRLKDIDYVSNVTRHYSSLIDQYPEIERISSGHTISSFSADAEKSFNRGFCSYFANGRQKDMANMDSPKSIGKYIGIVADIKSSKIHNLNAKQFMIDSQSIPDNEEIHNGDGLCYFENGELKGMRVNVVKNSIIELNESIKLKPGTQLYRNYDIQFVKNLETNKSIRKIAVLIFAYNNSGHLCLKAVDEDGNTVSYTSEENFDSAKNPNQIERLRQNILKSGDSEFDCTHLDYGYINHENLNDFIEAHKIRGIVQESVYKHFEDCNGDDTILFIPAAQVNSSRRELFRELSEMRRKNRPLLPLSKKTKT